MNGDEKSKKQKKKKLEIFFVFTKDANVYFHERMRTHTL